MSPRPQLQVQGLYAYSPDARGKLATDRVEVQRVYEAGGRWWVDGHDFRLRRTVTLQPGQIGAPVRPRQG